MSIISQISNNNSTKFQSIKSLLDYLRRRKNGFNLLCKTLSKTGQSFLVETLQNTKDNIPDVGRKIKLIQDKISIQVRLYHFPET